MQDSKVNTLTVPAAGADPATLFKANNVPMRVYVLNVGGANLFIAFDSNTLQDISVMAGSFRLPVGRDAVFVLAPKQGIYAASAGAGGIISIAVSEAIPEQRTGA